VENPTQQPPPSPAAAVDPKMFRKMMGCFATGVTIVTTKDGEQLHGMTVNSFTSVSLQPTLVLICLMPAARTTTAIQSRGWFVVNILSEKQAALSNHFARPNEDHYAGVNYALNEFDLPVLPDCVGHMVCRVHRIDPGGDHVIVIGEVVKFEFGDAAPLLFARGAYGALAPNPNV
jgi:4-hydroxyphenylacetate 3-hydroxylase, reductase component